MHIIYLASTNLAIFQPGFRIPTAQKNGRLGAVWFRWPHSASASWRSLGANLKHWSAGAKSVVLEAVPQLHQGMKKERLEAEVVNIWDVNICTLRTLCPLSTSITLYYIIYIIYITYIICILYTISIIYIIYITSHTSFTLYNIHHIHRIHDIYIYYLHYVHYIL